MSTRDTVLPLHRRGGSGVPSIASSTRASPSKPLKVGELYQPEQYGFIIDDPSLVRWCNFSACWRTVVGFICLPICILLVILLLALFGIAFGSFF